MADNQRIEDLRRRVHRDPTSIAFAQLAEECRRAGHYQEAVDVCRAGLEIHPGYLSARVTLGRSLIELNDLDVALAELEHVLNSAPDNLAAIRGVAEIRHRQGDLSEALTRYRAALALARNDPDLQRTVDELARKVEPVPAPAPDDGLSFEQMQNEFLQNLPPPPTVKPAQPVRTEPAAAPEPPAASSAEPEKGFDEHAMDAPSVSPPVSAPVVSIERMDGVESDQSSERARALQTIAALEQWVDGIHVARAQFRA
jgi:tetratricopeptide (TPR) repeat protein